MLGHWLVGEQAVFVHVHAVLKQLEHVQVFDEVVQRALALHPNPAARGPYYYMRVAQIFNWVLW